MSILNGKTKDFFGLDIGTTGIRLAKIAHSSNSLQTYAYMPLDTKIAVSDSKADQQKLVQLVKTLVDKSGVRTKNVAVGLPSQRVFTAVVDIERLSREELAKTIKLQADSLIPTPIAESKIDWELIGDSPQDKTKVEVLLSSVPNKYVEDRLDLIENIGLNVIAFEPDSLALVRALVAPDSSQAQMVLDMGNYSTDLVIILNGSPRLVRSIPTGYDSIIKAAVQNLNIDDAQARQFVAKFGLNPQKLEGQIFHAISGIVDLLISEVDKSIKFFSTRYQVVKIERIIVAGNATSLPDFPVYLANKFNLNVEVGNAWRNVSYSPDRQNELLAISSQFAVAVGLAERHL
jgi:type IV pilus assembly protein PilM